MARHPSYPRILARREGDGALLVALDATGGCVYDPSARTVYPRVGLATLAAQPYWQSYDGDGSELGDWPGPSPLPPQTPPPNPSGGKKKGQD